MSGTHALPRCDVAVLGPGRVGTTLAAALVRAGHRVVAVAGGRRESCERLAGHIAGVRIEDRVEEATRRADLVLLTTPDDALVEVVTAVAMADGFHEGQFAVHTSGAHGLDALERARLGGAHVAACHPAQTFPAGPPDPEAIVGAAWAVTAAGDDRLWARDLVEQLGGNPRDVADDVRMLYHAGLVVGSNAVGAAVAVARQLLLAARVEDPAAFLAPLVRASADNVLGQGANALTGPVVRGDVGTVEAHLERLTADAPRLSAAYRDLSRVILAQVRPSLDDDTAAALDRLLTGDRPWNE